MLDINLFRNDLEGVAAGLAKRGVKLDTAAFQALEAKRKDIQTRTQDLPPIFDENSNLYIFTADTLRQNRTRIGQRPQMFEIDRRDAWDIDEEIDFKVAEFLFLEREKSRG